MIVQSLAFLPTLPATTQASPAHVLGPPVGVGSSELIGDQGPTQYLAARIATRKANMGCDLRPPPQSGARSAARTHGRRGQTICEGSHNSHVPFDGPSMDRECKEAIGGGEATPIGLELSRPDVLERVQPSIYNTTQPSRVPNFGRGPGRLQRVC
jgi:hypothetical protein